MKKAALFDLDGVIIDSEGLYTRFWDEMDRLYPTGVENFALVIKGNTLPTILDRYFPSEDVQTDIRRRLKDFEHDMPVEVFPGVCDMVAHLRSRGYATAIVTSSSPAKMQRLFRRLPQVERLADIVLTDADVQRSKPDPEGYCLAAERLGCRTVDCVVFEDSYAGIEAGRRSGAKVVGIATTNPFEEVERRADITLRNTADADIEVIDRLLGH